MRRPTISIALAFGGSLCVASALALVVPLPHLRSDRASPAPAHRAIVAAIASPLPGVTPDADTAVEEVPFLPDRSSVTGVGEPSRLVIQSIQLDARVIDVGIVVDKGRPQWDTAGFAVGYYHGTALPGARGNVVMAGHISSPVSHKGDIFRHLPEVRIGDVIDVYSGDTRVRFSVWEVKVVAPTAIEVMAPTVDPTLTLLTCYPDNVYSRRLVVVAKLVGDQP